MIPLIPLRDEESELVSDGALEESDALVCRSRDCCDEILLVVVVKPSTDKEDDVAPNTKAWSTFPNTIVKAEQLSGACSFYDIEDEVALQCIVGVGRHRFFAFLQVRGCARTRVSFFFLDNKLYAPLA